MRRMEEKKTIYKRGRKNIEEDWASVEMYINRWASKEFQLPLGANGKQKTIGAQWKIR